MNNNDIIQAICDLATELAETREISADDLRAEFPDVSYRLMGCGLGRAVREGGISKLRKNHGGRWVYGKPKPVPTWCGIAPFSSPCRTAGKYNAM